VHAGYFADCSFADTLYGRRGDAFSLPAAEGDAVRWLRSTLREVWGLFVDDGSLAIAILVWVGALWLLPASDAPERWKGLILFAGLGLILMESALRYARKKSRIGTKP
jgi:hypothetical protein